MRRRLNLDCLYRMCYRSRFYYKPQKVLKYGLLVETHQCTLSSTFPFIQPKSPVRPPSQLLDQHSLQPFSNPSTLPCLHQYVARSVPPSLTHSLTHSSIQLPRLDIYKSISRTERTDRLRGYSNNQPSLSKRDVV